MPEKKIRTWVSHYRLHSIDGLRPKHSTYSEQFKLQVLSHQNREQLPAEKHRLVGSMATVQLLGVSSKPGLFSFLPKGELSQGPALPHQLKNSKGEPFRGPAHTFAAVFLMVSFYGEHLSTNFPHWPLRRDR